jgi:trimeric autotransporter adhesin
VIVGGRNNDWDQRTPGDQVSVSKNIWQYIASTMKSTMNGDWTEVNATGEFKELYEMAYCQDPDDNWLYIFGGKSYDYEKNQDLFSDEIFKLNLNTFEWSKIETLLPIPLYGFTANYVIQTDQNDVIYLLGGMKPDGTISSEIYRFDVVSNKIKTFKECLPSNTAIDVVACDSYTAPDGQVYNQSGTYMATFTNSAGCDSIITINLTINKSSLSTLNITACDQYTAPDGTIYQQSGQYTANLQNQAGCDSIININLTVNKSTNSNLDVTACDRYMAPDGTIFQESGQHTVIIPNQAGCDSIININLTVKKSTNSTLDVTACDFYEGPDGNSYTESGQHTAIIPNQAGCDSIIYINLTVNKSINNTLDISACDFYEGPDGNSYTESGTYRFDFMNAANCDSVVIVNLSIIQLDLSVQVSEMTLHANMPDANYQWLDCNNSFQAFDNENNSSFTPKEGGSFAVQIEYEGCRDTSDCYTIQSVGINPYLYNQLFTIQSISANGNFLIRINKENFNGTIKLLNSQGKIIQNKLLFNDQLVNFQLPGSKEVYFIKIESDDRKDVKVEKIISY